MKTLMNCLHHFSKFYHPPLTHTWIHSNIPIPPFSFCSLVSLTEHVVAPHRCVILLNDIMDTLVPLYHKGISVCFMHQDLSLLSSNTWHVLVPWFDITHRQTRNTTHTGGNRLTHTYKYIPTIMCSQQLSVLHFMNNSLISKFYFTEFHNVFASWKLPTCRGHISVDYIR